VLLIRAEKAGWSVDHDEIIRVIRDADFAKGIGSLDPRFGEVAAQRGCELGIYFPNVQAADPPMIVHRMPGTVASKHLQGVQLAQTYASPAKLSHQALQGAQLKSSAQRPRPVLAEQGVAAIRVRCHFSVPSRGVADRRLCRPPLQIAI